MARASIILCLTCSFVAVQMHVVQNREVRQEARIAASHLRWQLQQMRHESSEAMDGFCGQQWRDITHAVNRLGRGTTRALAITAETGTPEASLLAAAPPIITQDLQLLRSAAAMPTGRPATQGLPILRI